MSAVLRKGWCPGALRPMAAKDGLLVRLRLTGGILPGATAATLAELAMRYGNGLFDLSARANLQMRGVRESALPALQQGLRALGLLDDSAAGESVRSVIASPLAGLHQGLDIRPLVAALERRLVEDTTLHALPGKFGFLVDDGSWPSLANVAADVRFAWSDVGHRFAVSVGGTLDAAVPIGDCDRDNLVNRAAEIAAAFLAIARQKPDLRRMRHLVEAWGTDAVAKACGAPPPARERGARATQLSPQQKDIAREIVGVRTFRSLDLACLGLAAPFGRLDAAMLRAVAEASHHDIRLTPWRVLLLPGAAATLVPGFITDSADPRLSVAACPGAVGCARGTTDTQADADVFADALPSPSGLALHISGCEKGCAKPSRTPLTLVARDGRYDLVRNGRASDPPQHRDLDVAAVKRILEQEPA